MATQASLFDLSQLPPCGREWLQEADGAYVVAITIGTLAVVGVIMLSVLHYYYIHYYVSNEDVQIDLYYLIVLLPLVAMCSLLAMYLPRSSVLMFAVCLTYLMICLLKVISLMRNLFGSRSELSSYLTTKQQEVVFSTPPLCCCCKCLPKVEATEYALRHVEWMVNQSPIARVTLELIRIVSFLEQTDYETVKIAVTILEVVSMLTATWACQVLTRLSQKKLDKYRFGTIFIFVNATQAFFTIQKLIFDAIGAYGGFDNEDALTPTMKAYFWNNFTMTLEMLLIGILATLLVNPRKSALFDKYNADPNATKTPLAELSERRL